MSFLSLISWPPVFKEYRLKMSLKSRHEAEIILQEPKKSLYINY